MVSEDYRELDTTAQSLQSDCIDQHIFCISWQYSASRLND